MNQQFSQIGHCFFADSVISGRMASTADDISGMDNYVFGEEAIPALAIQCVGWFLIGTCALMFFRHALIRTIDHVLHMNILVASTGFLVSDWLLAVPGTTGCELFTLSFFIFGSAGTISAAAIAMERYRKMMRLSTTLPDRKWQLLQLFGVWFSSLVLILYPVFQKLNMSAVEILDDNQDVDSPDDLPPQEIFYQTVCFFSNSMIFIDSVISISFASVSVFIPLTFMLFCYIRIFRHVRSVRINRWLNHVAAQRSRDARVIKSHGRKANVFQVQTTPVVTSDRNFDTIAYSRERSILLKGIFSVCVVIASWVPFSTLLVYLSTNGFDENYVQYLKYVVVIAKLSVPMNIIHYICFNVRYRKLYSQSLLSIPRKLCNTNALDTVDNTSLADSHMVPTSQCYREAILATRTSGMHVLTPIIEPARSRNPSSQNLPAPRPQGVKRPGTPQSRQMKKVLLRTKSMPMCTKRSATVAPIY